MKMKQSRKSKIKIGDHVACTCCDEVRGKVIGKYTQNDTEWLKVQNYSDVCQGAETCVEIDKAVKI